MMNIVSNSGIIGLVPLIHLLPEKKRGDAQVLLISATFT